MTTGQRLRVRDLVLQPEIVIFGLVGHRFGVVASCVAMGGDVGGGGAGMPRFGVRTVASTRRDHQIGAGTLGGFERGLAGVGWFAHLGEPSRWDGGCVRISAWEQWPGPENALAEAFALMFQDLRDRIFAACPLPAADHLRVLFGRVSTAVVRRAGAAVPLFDLAADAWYAPTQCAWDAGYVAALIACVLACGWPVPEDLVEVWNWYEAGHWPSGFSGEPGDDLAVREAERLVFPRGCWSTEFLTQGSRA
jgi:hypothetical protein